MQLTVAFFSFLFLIKFELCPEFSPICSICLFFFFYILKFLKQIFKLLGSHIISISTIFYYKKIGIEIPNLTENLIEDIIKTQL